MRPAAVVVRYACAVVDDVAEQPVFTSAALALQLTTSASSASDAVDLKPFVGVVSGNRDASRVVER